jgi:ketosteroid isomerase-like protein
MVRRQLVVVVLVASCRGEEAKTPAAAARARDAAPARAAPPGEKTPEDEQAANQVDRKDAEALLAAWLEAQNGGDFAGYRAMYADGFVGVRRSGKKVRRFDRAGWMADRGRMFAKPMTVAAAAVQALGHGTGTHLFFTQTFEQGTYKDSGRKWMALERGPGGGLRIAREEMLDSTLIAQQEKELAAARAAPEEEGLADGEVALGWAGKRDRLYLAPIDASDRLVIGRVGGSIGAGPVTLAEHTFDAAGGGLGGVSAARAVDPKKLPPELEARLGKTVQLLDADLAPLCHAKISGYSLAVEDWVPANIDEEHAAAAALLDDAPVVLADLQMSGCPKGAAWARDVDLPPLPEVGSLAGADQARLRKEMQAETTDDDPDLEFLPVAGDPSRAVVALMGHTADSCETHEEYRIRLFLFTRKGTSWDGTTTKPFASYTYDDALALAVDADGDGTLDVFTTRGSHRGGDHSDFWRHDIRVFWPPGLGCDGCEGPGCGD